MCGISHGNALEKNRIDLIVLIEIIILLLKIFNRILKYDFKMSEPFSRTFYKIV